VLTREQKEAEVQELSEKFSRATSVFLADYRGLDVKSVDELRQKLREGAAEEEPFEYHVGKNSLLRRAVEGSDASALSEHLNGPTSYAISYGDPISLARVLVDYAKKSDDFSLKGAVVEGRAFGADEVGVVATLPTLQEARGALVGILQAPASKLARLLNEPGAQLARLVKARQESLGEGDG
jgi:large subunit ribosomal protein L10